MPIRARLIAVIGLTQTLAWASTFYLPAVIAGAVATSLHASRVAVIGGLSWALLVAGLTAPFVGKAIERRGGRLILAGGNLVLAAGLALLAAAPGLPLWYAGWTVLGFGMAMALYDAAFATLGRLLGTAAPGAIFGVTMIAGFASTIGWPTATALTAGIGWRGTALVGAALLAGVNAPVLWWLVPPLADGVHRAGAAQAAPPAHPGARQAFLLLAVFLTLRAAISATVSVHVLTLLHGLGLKVAATLAVAALLGPSQVSGRLIEAVGRRFRDALGTARIAAALMPLGILALLATGPSAAPGNAVAFAITYGISNGVLTITRGVVPLMLFGPAGYAERMGRLAMPQLIAQAAAPTLLTPLVTLFPARDAMALLGLVSLLAWGCLLGIRRPAPR